MGSESNVSLTTIVVGCVVGALLYGCNGGDAGARGDGGNDGNPDAPDSGGRNDGDREGGRPDDAAQDAGGDATSAPPFPTIIRVVNTGTINFPIYFQRSFTCPLGFMIRGDATGGLASTSIEQPDTTCDCATCGQGLGGGPRCISNDLLCEDPPLTLSPGGTFDFSWDGTVLTWFDAGTAEANCPVRCSRFTPVPSGTYLFSLTQPAGTFEAAAAALPAPNGVVVIPVSAS
jgi:hypothetical protein